MELRPYPGFTGCVTSYSSNINVLDMMGMLISSLRCSPLANPKPHVVGMC